MKTQNNLLKICLLIVLGMVAIVLTSCKDLDETYRDDRRPGFPNGGNVGNGNGDTIVAVTGINLQSTLALAVDGERILTATILPGNATNQAVTWISNNPEVATVDTNGVVVAVSEGTAIITVTTVDGDFTVTCYVEVFGTTDSGVVINGVRWATRNVAIPGTFVNNPEDAGMFYQWNKPVGWSSLNPMINSNGGTVWNPTTQPGEWEAVNCPCPPGWRIPTTEESSALRSPFGGTWIANWNDTGVSGSVFGTAPNQIFLPTAGYRENNNGLLRFVGTTSFYWAVRRGTAQQWSFRVDSRDDGSATDAGHTSQGTSGLLVRCVAE